jgi:hypothetical protein
MSGCSVAGCERKHLAKGLCSRHYRRLRLYGDPMMVKSEQLHGVSLRERVLHYTNIGDGCWLWSGSSDHNGYGRLNVGDVPMLAHRLSWEVHRGAIPDGMHVLHKCDNPACVNPSHLFLGTHQMNMADKMAKKRHRYGISRGEVHGTAKLTEQQVREIRASTGPSRTVGQKYGVSGRQVREIRARTAWTHVP